MWRTLYTLHCEWGIFQFYYTREFAMSVFVTYFHISARFFWKSWKKSFLINVSHFMSSWNLLQIFCLLLQLTAELSFKIKCILLQWRNCELWSSLPEGGADYCQVCLVSHRTRLIISVLKGRAGKLNWHIDRDERWAWRVMKASPYSLSIESRESQEDF